MDFGKEADLIFQYDRYGDTYKVQRKYTGKYSFIARLYFNIIATKVAIFRSSKPNNESKNKRKLNLN